jgi:hypothetical protein
MVLHLVPDPAWHSCLHSLLAIVLSAARAASPRAAAHTPPLRSAALASSAALSEVPRVLWGLCQLPFATAPDVRRVLRALLDLAHDLATRDARVCAPRALAALRAGLFEHAAADGELAPRLASMRAHLVVCRLLPELAAKLGALRAHDARDGAAAAAEARAALCRDTELVASLLGGAADADGAGWADLCAPVTDALARCADEGAPHGASAHLFAALAALLGRASAAAAATEPLCALVGGHCLYAVWRLLAPSCRLGGTYGAQLRGLWLGVQTAQASDDGCARLPASDDLRDRARELGAAWAAPPALRAHGDVPEPGSAELLRQALAALDALSALEARAPSASARALVWCGVRALRGGVVLHRTTISQASPLHVAFLAHVDNSAADAPLARLLRRVDADLGQ